MDRKVLLALFVQVGEVGLRQSGPLLGAQLGHRPTFRQRAKRASGEGAEGMPSGPTCKLSEREMYEGQSGTPWAPSRPDQPGARLVQSDRVASDARRDVRHGHPEDPDQPLSSPGATKVRALFLAAHLKAPS